MSATPPAFAQQTADEALAFVESRLTTQEWQSARFEHHRWKPSNLRLSAQQWTWDEAKEEWSPGFRKVLIESYSVDPRDLTTRVRAGKHSITFECRTRKCIKVTGTSATTIANNAPQQDAIGIAKAHNTWFFASEGESRRVAAAMSSALKALGAKARAY